MRAPDKKEPGQCVRTGAGPGTADANNVHAESSKVIAFARARGVETSSPALCSGVGQFHSPNNKKDPQPLQTITRRGVFAMADNPLQVEKEEARWVIFSELSSRVHAEQREHGMFHCLWGETDEPSGTLRDMTARVSDALDAEVWAYTTRSATEDWQKARFLVPLSAPVPGEDFVCMQESLNDRLEILADVTPDRANERAGQLCYLPNRGAFYDAIRIKGAPLDPEDWRGAVEAIQRRKEREKQQARQRHEIARLKARERVERGQASPIDAMNAEFPLEDMLAGYGYEQIGNRWLSPLSESGQAGVVISEDRQKWISSHGSDAVAGLGIPCNNGCMGDAFDLYCHFEHGGDRSAALRGASKLLGLGMATPSEFPDLSGSEPRSGAGDGPAGRALLVPVSEIRAGLKVPEFLIEQYLETEAFGLLFGEPGLGKSFLAYDMGLCVATGKDWHGHAVRTGSVVILAGEGHAGVARRIVAWELHHEIQAEQLHVSRRAVPMLEGESLAELVGEIDALPTPPTLIVVDTLARAFAGREENSTTDMGLFVNACDTLRQRYGCTVLVIHHPGHGDKSRSRGASNLKGALDAEYGLHRAAGDQKGPIVMSCYKLKDGEPPTPLAFRLESVPLPLIGEDGHPVTSAVPVVVKGASEARSVRMTPRQRYGADTLLEACTDGAALLEDWRVVFYRGHHGDTTEAKKKAFQRIRDELIRAGAVRVEDDVYTLTPEACVWGDFLPDLGFEDLDRTRRELQVEPNPQEKTL